VADEEDDDNQQRYVGQALLSLPQAGICASSQGLQILGSDEREILLFRGEVGMRCSRMALPTCAKEIFVMSDRIQTVCNI
jgi:hypothetical protein